MNVYTLFPLKSIYFRLKTTMANGLQVLAPLSAFDDVP